MDLGKYIHQLLKRRNEVYVKGLGTFKRIHTSSVYDEKKAMYLPPVTYLEFDAKSKDGFDFVDYVQQSQQLSRSDAEQQVEEHVIQLLENIKDHGVGVLHRLGQFIKHGNSLVFKAEDLSGFHLQPVEGTQEEVPVQPIAAEVDSVETIDEEPIEEAAIAEVENVEEPEVEEPANLIEEPTLPEEEPYLEQEVKSSNKATWYMIAAIVALGIIGTLFYLNRTAHTQEPQITDSVAQSPVSTVDTVLTEPQDTLANSVDSIAIDTAKQVVNSDAKPLIPANHHYQVVIGSHRTLAQAYEQAESFNKAGVTSVRVIPSKLAKNLKKVIWDSYETKEQADSALRYVQKRYVADAWSGPINK
ncbi:hypothetical protein GQF61_15140 [Sphingobacterium sp. DK4209]|uniref:CCDC81-like prokaryotic HU domain-containing protein n=1 Tax=Sphingobacterium zhuxiongii TaxID=2662364 RepID=A0A5Q0QD86_9SPHI|nr:MULTISPECIES: hypothetical protein [unclassified Sphingobacterium]MVZ67194.1 hypothetical protein [Sphingobacterium sp. DK4209]QGA25492.1 hypothetical protein GFH32_03785 [Sphingobacterium sp. dk4302]